LQNRGLISNFSPSRRIRPERTQTVSLDIALTSRCPLSCRYCTVEKTATRELRSGQWEEIIGSIAGLRTIESISLEGGEPFSREDLAQILASAMHHARRVKIVTGGVVPSRLPDSLVYDPRFSFEVSLDGPPSIHNFLRDQSFDQAFRFLKECLRTGVRVRFRTVVSRHNLMYYEPWLEELDRSLEGGKEKIGFFFDTIIAPAALCGQGGSIRRVPLRDFPARILVPSPLEIRSLFGRIKERTFRRLCFLQDEPLRGCRAVESPCLSFDPAGVYSFCCESPNGFGSILDQSPEACLSLLDHAYQSLPCGACAGYGEKICSGCWTGQKCGMVGHWGFTHCRELMNAMKGRNFAFLHPAPNPPPPF
jgi:sulfatase maturation enzyme AslB (radical SAM superfamily)